MRAITSLTVALAALVLLAGVATAFPFPKTKWSSNATAVMNTFNQYMPETTAITQTTAYFANTQAVTAYAATTGDLKYTIPIQATTTPPPLFAGPDEWLFFATNVSVYGYQAGVQKWATRLPPLSVQQILAVSPDSSKLVAAFTDGYVVEMNTTNGGIIFQYLSSDAEDTQTSTVAYTWDSSIVVVWNPDQTILAFEAATGAGLWENNQTQAMMMTVVGSYVVVYNILNGNDALTVYDALTGVQGTFIYMNYYVNALIQASNTSVVLLSDGVTAEYSVPGMVMQWCSNQWNMYSTVSRVQATPNALLWLYNNQDLYSIAIGSGYLEWTVPVTPYLFMFYGSAIGVSQHVTKGTPLISFTVTYETQNYMYVTARQVMTAPNPAVVTEERCQNAPKAKPCTVGCTEATYRTVCTSETPDETVSYQTVWNAYRCAPGNASVPIHVTHTKFTGQSCSGNPTYETVHFGGLCVIGDNFTASIVKDCFEPL